MELPDDPIYLRCDSLQIGQALTNLLKNAAESVVNHNKQGIGVIRCSLSQVLTDNPPLVSIAVHDNGAGLPEAGRENLTEPYVTRREGGTGLGLAIVKKIMEDHSGKIVLSNNEDGGATINLLFYQTDDREKIEPEL